MSNITRVGVVGGGAWGTALAQTACIAGRSVLLWARDPSQVEEIASRHTNSGRLPGVTLDSGLRATTALSDMAGVDALLLVVPAQAIRRLAEKLRPLVAPSIPVVICAKGIEQSTGLLMTDVVAEILPENPRAVLSGPGFADEVVRGLPTALTLAARDEELGRALTEALGCRHFRLYWSSDETGVALGGAMKNVLAIAAGIVIGRRLGASAHAALVTRGFAELTRLGAALGARPETMAGLSGLGDLMLTCSSPLSRNMSLGLALASSATVDEAMARQRSLAEGASTAVAVVRTAAARGVEVPISAAVHAILERQLTVDDAIMGLLSRPFRAEA